MFAAASHATPLLSNAWRDSSSIRHSQFRVQPFRSWVEHLRHLGHLGKMPFYSPRRRRYCRPSLSTLLGFGVEIFPG